MTPSPICSREVETRAHVLPTLPSEEASRDGAESAGQTDSAGNPAPEHGCATLHEAYQKGVEDARRQAEAEILRAAEALAKAAGQLQSLERGFVAQAQRDLLRLSLAIARRVLMAEMRANPDALGEMVARLLDEAEDRKVVAVRLHPEDAKHFNRSAAAQSLRQAGIAVQPSPEVGPGGVILETGFGKLDARLDTRLDEIAVAVLGDVAQPPSAGNLKAAQRSSDGNRTPEGGCAALPNPVAGESLWENQPSYSFAHAASVERQEVAQPPSAGKLTPEGGCATLPQKQEAHA